MRRVLIFASTVVLVGALGLLAFGFTRNTYDLPSPLIGKAAPEFALDVLSSSDPDGMSPVGGTVRLSRLRGEIVILNFWASWCLACVEEHPALSETADLYRDRGVSFLGVLYQDERAPARRWLARMGGQSYPTLLDPGSLTAIAYGVYGVPETYVIDVDGRVRHRFVGPVTNEMLEVQIEGLSGSE
jgi:cytochrome c biogenesis protein CcmG/thiol:disulfide interchange protein DsbE